MTASGQARLEGISLTLAQIDWFAEPTAVLARARERKETQASLSGGLRVILASWLHASERSETGEGGVRTVFVFIFESSYDTSREGRCALKGYRSSEALTRSCVYGGG